MDSKGFTLVEILVVIAITALISGMVISNMRKGGEVSDLRSSAQKLTEVVKQAQMMAFSGKQISGVRIDGGYGVYVNDTEDPSSYKLFVNDYQPDSYAFESDDTVLKDFKLSKDVFLSQVDHYFIIFVPPGRNIYVGTTSPGTLLTSDSLVTLKHEIGRYAYIEINSQGRINLTTP